MAQFDIFETESDGGVLWRGTAANLDEARAVVGKLAAKSPREFIVLNVHTGSRLLIKGEGPQDRWPANGEVSFNTSQEGAPTNDQG